MPAAKKPTKKPAAKTIVTAGVTRCDWANGHALLASYHDEEWGVPIHDDLHFYEKLVLDGAQAGLSWLTILKKREAYREALCGFDPERVARFGAREEAKLMQNAGIVRNKLKVRSAVVNARAFLKVQEQHGSFDRYIWELVGGATLHNRRRSISDVPARTELSDAVSKNLKQRGFSFVGTTIVYAFMQASGLVNDHLVSCPRHAPIAGGEVRGRPRKRR